MNPYLLPHLPLDRPYSWVLTVDPNKRHGGLLTAIDHEGNRFYTLEHYAENLPDRLHVNAYLRMLAVYHLVPGQSVEIFADPGGAGAQAIINMSDLGLYCQAVPKDAGSVKASIELIRRVAWIDPQHWHPFANVKGSPWEGRRGAPHCYFLPTLCSDWKLDGVDYHESRLMWELRQYRQKENSPPDTPIKEKDDLADCMRYVELVRPFSPAYVDRTEELARAGLDAVSRRASEEFEDMVKQANKPKPVAEPAWESV